MKLLKPERLYLIKKIEGDIAVKKAFLEHRLDWMQKNKPRDPYFQKGVNAANKKIAFLQKLLEKISTDKKQ